MKESNSLNRKIIRIGNSLAVTLAQKQLERDGFIGGEIVDVKLIKIKGVGKSKL